jgi:chromosome segregation ATPase
MEKTVGNAVSALRSEIDKRNSSIKQKITSLESEASATQATIDQLMRNLVDREMAGDIQGQEKAEKDVAMLRQVYNDLAGRVQAYQATLADPGFIRPGLKSIFELANYAQQERVQEDARKNAEIQTLEQQLLDLREKLLQLHGSARASSQQQQRDLREIASLLPLIERRPIEQDQEVPYLRAFTQGATPEMLERYLARTSPGWAPQQQQRDGVVVKLPLQSGPVGPVRDLCRGEHTNNAFASVEK